MSNILKRFLVTSSVILLAACTTHLSKQECQTTNWYQRGRQAAATGHMPNQLTHSARSCERFGIAVQKRYHRGWLAGTKQFCTTDNAYKLGQAGEDYAAICSGTQAKRFVKAWRRGLRSFCTPINGYDLGASGATLPTFCARDQVVNFKRAYLRGKQDYTANNLTDTGKKNVNDNVLAYEEEIGDLRTGIAQWVNKKKGHRYTETVGTRFHDAETLQADQTRSQNWRIYNNS